METAIKVVVVIIVIVLIGMIAWWFWRPSLSTSTARKVAFSDRVNVHKYRPESASETIDLDSDVAPGTQPTQAFRDNLMQDHREYTRSADQHQSFQKSRSAVETPQVKQDGTVKSYYNQLTAPQVGRLPESQPTMPVGADSSDPFGSAGFSLF